VLEKDCQGFADQFKPMTISKSYLRLITFTDHKLEATCSCDNIARTEISIKVWKTPHIKKRNYRCLATPFTH